MAESSGESKREGETIRVGILTVSDQCYEGHSEDRSGANLKHLIEDKELLDAKVSVSEIVPDDEGQIRNVLTQWADCLKLDLILSTGGTGFTARDVTPEATKSVLERDALGITVAMLTGSLNITPLAMLSRLTCGIRKSTLIINLPGSTKGAEECFRFAVSGVSHAVDQLRGSSHSVKKTHKELQGETTHTNQPGQFQPLSDESMDNSVENCDRSSAISDSSIHTEFHESMAFESLDTREMSISIPDNIEQSPHIDPETQSTILSNGIAGVNNKEDNSRTEFSQLCFHAEQSNTTNIPAMPLSVSSLVINDSEALHQPVYEKQDKDVIDLFPFHGHCGDSSQPVLLCKLPKLRPAPEIPTQIVQEMLTLPTGSNLATENMPTSTNDVYDFNEESDNQNKAKAGARQPAQAEPILRAKLHKTADEGEITHVDVGSAIKTFLWTHPALRGIYLNKGKRDVKRHLVRLKRESKAIDIGSWRRGGRIHDRNRFDDYFELTEEGAARREKVLRRVARDEYVVNWYMWCPGHGNCRRRCGGYGRCVNDCKGKTHKQDRHNCSLLVNIKMFLSNTSKWRVQISGNHVPLESSILWEPPRHDLQRINEDTRDVLIASAMSQAPSTSQIQEELAKRPAIAKSRDVPSKRKICRFMSSMRKRRRQKNYNYRDGRVEDVDDAAETESSVSCRGQPDLSAIGTCAGSSDDKNDDDEEEEEDLGEELINVEEVENKADCPVNPQLGENISNFAMRGFHAVADSASLDESNLVPSVALFKMTDTAGNVYLCTGNVSAHRSTSSRGTLDTASPAQRDLASERNSNRFVYAPPHDVPETSGAGPNPDMDASTCGDLGALIMAAYQQ